MLWKVIKVLTEFSKEPIMHPTHRHRLTGRLTEGERANVVEGKM